MDEDLFDVFGGAAGVSALDREESKRGGTSGGPQKREKPASVASAADGEQPSKRRRGEDDAQRHGAALSAEQRRTKARQAEDTDGYRLKVHKAPAYAGAPENKRIVHEYVLPPGREDEAPIRFGDKFDEGFKPAKVHRGRGGGPRWRRAR